MEQPRHAPGWRGRPASYADLRPADNSDELNSFEIFSIFGCLLMAAAALGAGIYASLPAIGAWLDNLL